MSDDGERSFVFYQTWIGWIGGNYPEYRQYAEEIMRELQDLVVTRCTPE